MVQFLQLVCCETLNHILMSKISDHDILVEYVLAGHERLHLYKLSIPDGVLNRDRSQADYRHYYGLYQDFQ